MAPSRGNNEVVEPLLSCSTPTCSRNSRPNLKVETTCQTSGKDVLEWLIGRNLEEVTSVLESAVQARPELWTYMNSGRSSSTREDEDEPQPSGSKPRRFSGRAWASRKLGPGAWALGMFWQRGPQAKSAGTLLLSHATDEESALSEFDLSPTMRRRQRNLQSVSWQTGDTPRTPAQRQRSGSTKHSDSELIDDGIASILDPVLQFSSPTYFFTDLDDFAALDVVRLGDLSKPSTVYYQTKDVSGCEGRLYEHVLKSLTFERGESMKQIEVPLLELSVWNPSLDFMVELLTEGLENASLGEHGGLAEVKVGNFHSFPSSASMQQTYQRTPSHLSFAKKLHEAPKSGLLLAYLWWNLKDPRVFWATMKTLLKDQIHNFYFIVKLLLAVYLVDGILKHDDERTWWVPCKEKTGLLIITAITVLPLVLLHCIDYVCVSWRLPGISRAKVQSALLQQFMDYEESSRFHLKAGDLIMAMTRDTPNLVNGGYMSATQLAKQLGRLILLVAYQFGGTMVFGKGWTLGMVLTCLLPSVLLPLFLIAFLLLRRGLVTRLLFNQNEKQNVLVDQAMNIVLNFGLIADFGQKSRAAGRFDSAIQDYNQACVEFLRVEENDEYFFTWLSTLSAALFTYFGGTEVLAGTLPLGVFLGGVHVFSQLGQAWGLIYRCLSDMQQALPGLQRIVFLLNLTTDHHDRTSIAVQNAESALILMSQMQNSIPVGERMDALPIVVQDVRCSFLVRSSTGQILRSASLALRGDMSIDQGQFISFVGPVGGGKSSLLKVIGGTLLPQSMAGMGFFVPSHLRILHVGNEPTFFMGTLLENLTIGVRVGSSDGNPDRVWSICHRLGLHEDVLEYLDQGEALAWNQVLSQSQRHLLCVARGLIANPDLLVMHKPTSVFDEKTSFSILSMLREFVDCRGVEAGPLYGEDPQAFHRRRPRTCIITSSKQQGIEIADKVFHVSKNTGIRPLEKTEVTADMMR
mmetsp:Transcript_91117/g.199587  ORF Transcript_91117/g.199587 Transcript_91117/m.199587 type:complete len:972 (+) Transcript_91117:251-3166(+)